MTRSGPRLFNIHWFKTITPEVTMLIQRRADINAVRSYVPGFDPDVHMLGGSTPGRMPGMDNQYYHIVEVED